MVELAASISSSASWLGVSMDSLSMHPIRASRTPAIVTVVGKRVLNINMKILCLTKGSVWLDVMKLGEGDLLDIITFSTFLDHY